MPPFVFLSTRFKPGAFSTECLFELTTYSGEPYFGLAPIDYCFNERHDQLSPTDPHQGHAIDGLIQALLVDNGGDKCRVSIPDGATIEVNASILHSCAA